MEEIIMAPDDNTETETGTVSAGMSMSLDGFIAGPNAGPQNALGDEGHRIHQWQPDLESQREQENRPGGETNRDGEVLRESYANVGAYVMGRRMFDEGEVNWENPPPFRAPVFVLTHESREPWVREGGTTFTFVTDGIESALAHAQEAAGDENVRIAGGANVVQQFIDAGLLNELYHHLAPLLLGDGVRLFDNIDTALIELETTLVVASPTVTHLKYRVAE